jgi:hypothetical protein
MRLNATSISLSDRNRVDRESAQNLEPQTRQGREEVRRLAMGYKIGIVCLWALALVLFLTDARLTFRHYQYSQLLEQHECGYPSERACRADFDGDGQLTEIRVRYRYDTPVELPPRFKGSEANVVLNAFLMDNTLRTHIAIGKESSRDRLIVYEGAKWPDRNRAVNAVYEHNGNGLVSTSPTAADEEILKAMAARDDAGTLNLWVVYTLLVWPVRIIYLALFAGAALGHSEYRLR